MTDLEQSRKELIKARVEKISEYAAGLTLLSKGWEEAERFKEFPAWVIFIFAAGAFVIVGTIVQEKLEHKLRSARGLFHALEGVVEIIGAAILLDKGKHWIPLFLGFVGLLYLSGGLVELLTRPEKRERAERRLRVVQAIAFIAFAIATAAWTTFTDRELMVYVIAVVLIAGGTMILKRKGRPMKKLGMAGKIVEKLTKEPPHESAS
jgi:uncharacterized membrane protein HdeD (DUF308 family)